MAVLAEVAREKLQVLEAEGRRRILTPSFREEGARVERGGRTLISFGCNDYLGFTQHPKVKEAAIEATKRYGTGAGAARLVSGNHPLYALLEAKLAAWKGAEAALVFGSGYLANTSVISAMVRKGDLILVDRLVHACILDGAQLSGAKLMRFAHNDVADCARLLELQRGNHNHCLIVTDEVFSMDGDRAPLAELARVAKAHDAWIMADGAHSISASHAPVDIYTGTLSKALGSYGGYVAASRSVIDCLSTSARGFMFSTGLPPAAIASASAALELLMDRTELAGLPIVKARLFTNALGLSQAQSPIVPLVIGDEARALAAAKKLEEAGYFVPAIRPPTVPKGTSRLRFAFSALHAEEDIAALASLVKKEDWA